ncbi:MAG: hypothetical protein D6732_20180 [Methanobacteriota archaeon]|nr:MAG: hypothetical protein D6732_20180 [Euryarchaeota archaeon]
MISEDMLFYGTFVVVFLIFLPFIAQAVRVAVYTWDHREEISKERKKEVFLNTPLMILIAYFFVNWLVFLLFQLLKSAF